MNIQEIIDDIEGRDVECITITTKRRPTKEQLLSVLRERATYTSDETDFSVDIYEVDGAIEIVHEIDICEDSKIRSELKRLLEIEV